MVSKTLQKNSRLFKQLPQKDKKETSGDGSKNMNLIMSLKIFG
jgi:hypothetical protein